MPGRAELQPAWLLQSRPYGDTSLLAECFTRDFGRVGFIARGVRGPKSRLRGVLQMFTPLWLGFGGRGELRTLTTAEAERPIALVGERVFYGWYVNELVLKLLHRDDPHPELMPQLGQTFAALQGDHAERALRQFELALLDLLGFGIAFPDVHAEAQRYRWDVSEGLLADPRGPYSATTLLALSSDAPLPGAAATEARQLLRTVLRVALAGKRLETPLLLREMRRHQASAGG